MKPKHLLFIAAAAAALLLLRLLLVGPEERLRREMLLIASDASKSGPEKPIVAAATARSLSRRFAVDAEALDSSTDRRVAGQDAIARVIGWARESWDDGEVAFEDLEIELSGEEGAEVRARLRILGPDGFPASPHDGTRIRLEWAKTGGKWEIRRAEAGLQ